MDLNSNSNTCYICDKNADEFRSNLTAIKSQHSGSSIAFFINKFLSEFQSDRDVIDPKNGICMGCLQKIEEYDWSCMMAERFEKELSEILLKTEIHYGELNQEKKIEEINVDEKNDSFYIKFGVSKGFQKISNKKDTKMTDESIANVVQEQDNIMNDKDPDFQIDDQSENTNSDTECLPPCKSTRRISTQNSNLISRSSFTEKVIEGRLKQQFVDVDQPEELKRRKGRPTGTHGCSECDKTFTTKRDLNVHIRWHKKQRLPEFKCSICFFVLADQKSFDDHLELHESVPPLECVLCRKRFTQRGNMHLHMKIHVGTPNHQCELCGKLFIHSTSFEAHMKYHLNIRTITCPQPHCDKRFITTSHLYRHLQSHTKEKPYSCGICSNRFRYLTNMRAHEKMHTQTDKTHICKFCSSAFARKSKLNQHLQKNHATMLPHSTIENNLQSNEEKNSNNEI